MGVGTWGRRAALLLQQLLLLLLLFCAACRARGDGRKETMVSERPQQWRVTELTFEAQGAYASPAAEVTLIATFSGPGGASYEMPGFWDGEGVWKVRFTPPAAGRWQYTTRAVPEDAGLHGKTGRLTARAAAGENPLLRHGGFLRVSDDRRYLTYSDGTPFFWLGDTWWFSPSALVPFDGASNPEYASMYRTLIDTRQAQGFSIVQMAFLGPMPESGGVNSLADQGRAGVIDVAYWREVDRYIVYANEAGILPVIGLAFHSGLEQLDLAQWTFLWRYVIARYGAFSITWLIGGEYNADIGNRAERVPVILALGQAIKDADPYRRAMTVHPWWYQGDTRDAWDQPWYDFIMLQGAHGADPPLSLYHDAYARETPLPLLEAECNYEGIRGMTDVHVRWAAYRGIQAGSFGYTYGAHGLWYPTQSAEDTTFAEWGPPIPWWDAMKQPGAAQMRLLRDFYESLAWWELTPRPTAVTSTPVVPDQIMPAVKALRDEVFVVYFARAYPRTAGALLEGLRPGATYQARWFDPRTGEWTPHAAPLSAGAGGDLLLPERPDSSLDWLLVLTVEATDR